MVVSPIVLAYCEPRKAVQVELSLKARKLGLAKVFGHDVISKLLWIVNHKAAAMWLPGNHVSESIFLHLIENGVKLDGKGHGDAASALGSWQVFRIVLWNVVGVIVIVVHHKVAIVLLGGLAWLLGFAAASWLLRVRLHVCKAHVQGHGAAGTAAAGGTHHQRQEIPLKALREQRRSLGDHRVRIGGLSQLPRGASSVVGDTHLLMSNE